MEKTANRTFIRNEWFEFGGNRYGIRLFHDDESFYLETCFEDGSPACEPMQVSNENCIEFKRFNNYNLLEDLFNQAKRQIRMRLPDNS
jgi:hypothetical protein